MRVGLVGTGPHGDPSQKHAVCAVLQHTLEDLAGGAAGRGVVDHRGGGRFLLAPQEIGAIDPAGGTLTLNRDLNVLAREARARGEREALVAGAAREARTRHAEMDGIGQLVLDANVIE
jgi:hypothetical protein